jgi:hypothetical protein
MAFKIWNSGDILTASDLNSFVVKCQSTYKQIAGQTAFSLSSASSVIITVSYGFTFATIVAFVGWVQSGSNIDLISTGNGAPGLSSAGVRICTPGLTSTTISSQYHWIVIGT